jgi:cyclic-di-AMP phosphodiesterase PgpH
MRLLERLGFARKPQRRRPGSFELQRRPKTGRSLTREEVIARVVIFSALVVLTMLMFPQAESYEIGTRVREGDIWQRDEVIAPFSFAVFKSEEQLQAERDSVRYEEPPVFARVPEAQQRTSARLDSLELRIERVLDAYVDWQENLARDNLQGAQADSARYASYVDFSELDFSPTHWEALLTSYVARTGMVTPARPTATGPPLHDVLLREVAEVSNQILPLGVLDVPRDSVLTPQIAVVDLRDRTEGVLLRSNVFGWNNAVNHARAQLNTRFAGAEDTVRIAMILFERALQPSLAYQREETRARWAEREQRISRTTGLVQEGEAIVRRGDYVTQEIQRRLESLARVRAEQQGGIGPFRIFAGQLILSGAAFLIFFLYLFLLRRQLYDETRYILLIAILFAVIVSFFGVTVRLTNAPSFAVPVALASIIITVIFDSRVGMFATVTLACLGGVIFGYDFEFAFATVVAGMVAVFSMRDVKNRSQILLTAGLVFVAYLAVLGGFTLMRAAAPTLFLREMLLVAINTGLLLLAYPFLLIFERSFGVTTDITLLELSDTNSKLLRNLSSKAPGTFNHSIQVANLAESAADAIGANALLARVGALYHDIGKSVRPEYYIENQQPGHNPHDDISPYMSALIIAEHVKAGAELGRQHGLPDVVLAFIPTHHGTTLMEYFYRKAGEMTGDGDAPVDPSEFRYPGPIPQTNEQGIVMLADSVEAASRSLDKPTPRRLEGIVDAIFQARIEDGQLAATQLTFSDVARIKETFLSILNGIYHFRVKYPDKEGGDGAERRTRASAPEPPPPPEPDDLDDVGPSSAERASLG